MAFAHLMQLWLSPNFLATNTPSTLTLNDTARKVAIVQQSPTADAITHIGFHHKLTVGTSPTYRVSVQGIDSSGNPDGTVKGGGSPASATFNSSSLGYAADSYQWVALDNSYTPSRGEQFALVVDYSSGTVDGSNYSQIGYYISYDEIHQPLALDYQATWTKRAGTPVLAFRTSTAVFGFPFSSTRTFSISGSTETGLRFTLPTWISGCKVAGIKILSSVPSGQTYGLKLYDGGDASDTTVLQSATGIDGDVSVSGNRNRHILFQDTSLTTLYGGSTYRITITPGASGTSTIYAFDATDASLEFSAFPFGNNVCITSRSGGNWTDTTTSRPWAALLLEDVTVASAGGGVRQVNIRGGADQ